MTNTLASVDCEVAIIGAGPYGLALAAHLRSSGFAVKTFGNPMHFWATGMPSGMLLRSPREASTISDPAGALTLETFEAEAGIQPEKRIRWETFVAYGKWFGAHLDGNLHPSAVSQVSKKGSVFRLLLSDGAEVQSRRVVVAAGIQSFKTIPAEFAELSPAYASHCYEGRRFCELGRRVAVIGAGQSALESAALLHEAGAEVELIARIPTLRWIGMHKRLHELGPISKMLYSKHDIGPIGISRLVAYPELVRRIPTQLRDRIRKRAVRSAGAPWLIPRLNEVKITTGRHVVSASNGAGEVRLLLDDGTERRVDHVLIGTGYRVDVSQYRFLAPDLLKRIQQRDGYPDLAAGFSSSVPGLHFVGATAARTFGPLMYFVTGTDFASRELSSWLCNRPN